MGLISGTLALGATVTHDIVKSSLNRNTNNFITPVKGPGDAMLADPFVWVFAGGNYVERPKSLSYSVLRYLQERDPILGAIVITRLRQMRSYCNVLTHEETERTIGNGFRIKLRVGANKRRTKAVTRVEDNISQIFKYCAKPDVKKEDRIEQDFGKFIWRFCWDRLVLDQACAELVLDRKGSLVQFYAVDGATIRIVNPVPNSNDRLGKYAQVYRGQVISRFNDSQLAFCPENVSTDIERRGYGRSEIEFALRSVLTHLGIEASNERIFHPGSMPKGLLWLKNSEISDEQMRIMEHKWRNQISTMKGRQNLPMLSLPRGSELNLLKFPQATEMEYKTFTDYLVNVLTSLYGMDPVEINFPNRGGPGLQGGALSSANESARITHSKDKGLKPMLSWFQTCINNEIMPAIDPENEFEFVIVGLDAKSDQEKADLLSKHVKTFKTVNEARRDMGLEEIENSDIILDSVWLQAKQAAEQAVEQELGEEGAEGAEVAEVAEGEEGEEVAEAPETAITEEEATEVPVEGTVGGGEAWKAWISAGGPGKEQRW